jgi:DNA-binding cell septation regulator SpoVG
MPNNVPLPPPGNQFTFVLQIRPSPKDGHVKAYADIQYHNVTIRGVSVVQHNGGHFVGFPNNVGKNGKRFPIVEFSQPERSQIEKLVLDTAAELDLL